MTFACARKELCRYGKGRYRYVPGELGLKDHQASIAKSYFADGEIKLPHATKPLVVDPIAAPFGTGSFDAKDEAFPLSATAEFRGQSPALLMTGKTWERAGTKIVPLPLTSNAPRLSPSK